MWRDHLLAASLVVNRDFDEGAFVFLAPKENKARASAVAAFAAHVAVAGVFASWTLEDVVAAAATVSPWAEVVRRRYLGG